MNYELLIEKGFVFVDNGLLILSERGIEFATFCLLSKTFEQEFPDYPKGMQPDKTHTDHIFKVLIRKGILYENGEDYTDYGGKILFDILEELTEDDFDEVTSDE